MKYWTFDVIQLIADYNKNQRVVAAVNMEIKNCEMMLDNPIGNSTRGDWEQMLKILRMRKSEYEMYADMVYIGFNALPEVEREVLKMWLMDGDTDEYIIEHCGIASNGELTKIKKIALTRFTNIVMPN